MEEAYNSDGAGSTPQQETNQMEVDENSQQYAESGDGDQASEGGDHEQQLSEGGGSDNENAVYEQQEDGSNAGSAEGSYQGEPQGSDAGSVPGSGQGTPNESPVGSPQEAQQSGSENEQEQDGAIQGYNSGSEQGDQEHHYQSGSEEGGLQVGEAQSDDEEAAHHSGGEEGDMNGENGVDDGLVNGEREGVDDDVVDEREEEEGSVQGDDAQREGSISPPQGSISPPQGSISPPQGSISPPQDGTPQHSDDEEGDDIATQSSAKRAIESGGEEVEEDGSPRKKHKQDDDDLDNVEENAGAAATMEDLFGDASDLSDSDDDKPNKETEGAGSDDEGANLGKVSDDEDNVRRGTPSPTQRDLPSFMEEDEPAAEIAEEVKIDIDVPKIVIDLGSEHHFVKFPNFLSVDTRPFDPQTYEDEIDDDEVLDEEGRSRLKLKVDHALRWRWGYDDEGNPKRESNARVVKWSDGSMSLHLGKQIFDIHKQNQANDHNHLYIRQGLGLQGQAIFNTKLSFRPNSIDSETHRQIIRTVSDRSQKVQKIKVLPIVGKDPESSRNEMIKKEDDRLKAGLRRESKQKRVRERSGGRGLNDRFLEPDRYEDDEEDEDGGVSISAIKNKYKKGGSGYKADKIYSSDSEASDTMEEKRAKRLERAKARLAESDEESGEDDTKRVSNTEPISSDESNHAAGSGSGSD